MFVVLKVYIEGGNVYVPTQKLLSIIVARFRMSISKALTTASAAFSSVCGGDSRISPLLKNMHKMYVGREFGGVGSVCRNGSGADRNITTSDVYALSEKGMMPLCMRQLTIARVFDERA